MTVQLFSLLVYFASPYFSERNRKQQKHLLKICTNTLLFQCSYNTLNRILTKQFPNYMRRILLKFTSTAIGQLWGNPFRNAAGTVLIQSLIQYFIVAVNIQHFVIAVNIQYFIVSVNIQYFMLFKHKTTCLELRWCVVSRSYWTSTTSSKVWQSCSDIQWESLGFST